jgi:ATP-citrate lyase beta-subunit
VSDWSTDDFRSPATRRLTPQEQVVQELAEKSQASFKLDVLNPDGSIFLLLSGGGASIVVADEVYNNGQGDRLANYGEYSGNPNTEETYLYTKAVLQLVLDSPATPKILFVGGAVANFTDVASTFDGIIRALDEHGTELRDDRVKVFVRRGGPRQEIGLERIEAALRRLDLLGAVHSPAVPLTEALKEALKETV